MDALIDAQVGAWMYRLDEFTNRFVDFSIFCEYLLFLCTSRIFRDNYILLQVWPSEVRIS